MVYCVSCLGACRVWVLFRAEHACGVGEENDACACSGTPLGLGCCLLTHPPTSTYTHTDSSSKQPCAPPSLPTLTNPDSSRVVITASAVNRGPKRVDLKSIVDEACSKAAAAGYRDVSKILVFEKSALPRCV